MMQGRHEELSDLFGGEDDVAVSPQRQSQPQREGSAAPTAGFICPDCAAEVREAFPSAEALLRHFMLVHSGMGSFERPAAAPAPSAPPPVVERAVVATRVELGDEDGGGGKAPPAAAAAGGDSGTSGVGQIVAEGFICPDCAAPFADAEALLAHAAATHAGQQASGFVSEGFICPDCKSQLPNIEALLAHCKATGHVGSGGAAAKAAIRLSGAAGNDAGGGSAATLVEEMEFDDDEMDALDEEMAGELQQYEEVQSRLTEAQRLAEAEKVAVAAKGGAVKALLGRAMKKRPSERHEDDGLDFGDTIDDDDAGTGKAVVEDMSLEMGSSGGTSSGDDSDCL